MSLLSLDNFSVTLGGTPVLSEISLTLAAGQIFGLVGESGSGKSMTALALMGLLPDGAQTSGRILMDGQDLSKLDDSALCKIRGNRIGMIFQEPMTALNPLMTIGDQVAETLRIHTGERRARALEIARERLDRVGLTAPRFPLTLYPHELSGGQRQRVAIALAIALRPAILIADEPTTALDVTTQAQILALLQDLVQNEGMGLLLITHDIAVIANLAQRTAVIKDGRIIENSTTEALFRTRTHPYTKALFTASIHQPAPVRNDGTLCGEYLGQKKAGAAFFWPKYSNSTAPHAQTLPPATPLLTVTNVTRTYRLPRPSTFAAHPELHAVDNVSFSLFTGESLGLVGESGCGKSTLTRTILGLDPLEGGTITLHGMPVSRAMPAALRAQMQVVFQDPYGSFNPRHRVDRLVAEPFYLTGRPPDWSDRVAEALRDVGLSPDDRQKHIHEFSGGQRQRIAIARALIIRPALIVLDEAVSALDVRARAKVLDLLAELRAARNLAYLFISHDLSVVRTITSRVLVMRAGKIVEEGASKTVLTTPRHPYTAALIADTPQIPSDWMGRG
ncbi:ABC transporter ATP-binding protein [Phaeovulum sp.]|uniref:ABC transporter ATP-binding protein n=1 Tax=Phaeovulum sp. TaxID=2934796 RepID=UPI0039E46AD1